jgi:hypothetical protein
MLQSRHVNTPNSQTRMEKRGLQSIAGIGVTQLALPAMHNNTCIEWKLD